MPINKNAWLRYLIIIRELKCSSWQEPATKEDLIDAIVEELGMEVSISTIEKDLSFLKNSTELGVFVPIVNVKHGSTRKGHITHGYYISQQYKFSQALAKTWRI